VNSTEIWAFEVYMRKTSRVCIIHFLSAVVSQCYRSLPLKIVLFDLRSESLKILTIRYAAEVKSLFYYLRDLICLDLFA